MLADENVHGIVPGEKKKEKKHIVALKHRLALARAKRIEERFLFLFFFFLFSFRAEIEYFTTDSKRETLTVEDDFRADLLFRFLLESLEWRTPVRRNVCEMFS